MEKSGKERCLLFVLFSEQEVGGSVKRGHEFCVARSRISREVWVADFAWF
jgi:hypothetical protein